MKRKIPLIWALLAAGVAGAPHLSWAGTEDREKENAMELVIAPQTLTAAGDILTTLDIISEQKRLSDGASVAVKEGHVTVGRPLVYAQSFPVPEGTKVLNRGTERFYLLQLPFTLHPLPTRQCRKLTFHVHLAPSDARSLKLIPMRVTTQEEVSETWELDGAVSLPAIGVKGDAKTVKKISYTKFRPVIKSYGLGQPHFYWIFEGSNGEPVEDGSKVVAASLSTPSDVRSLKLTLSWELDWEKHIIDSFRKVPVKIDETTLDLQLQ